jgi:hypothetical protein
MTHVYVSVPRVVAELLDLTPALVEVLTMRHEKRGLLIRQRTQAARIMSDHIQAHPSAWGVWSDDRERWRLASRLLELRERIRSCQIAEAAEEAAL